MMLSHRERLILLNLIPDIGSLRLRRLLDAFGSLEQLWKAGAQELQQVDGIGPVLARRLVEGFRNERLLNEELALVKREGVSVITLDDAVYPTLLREIHDPPLVLCVKGSLSALDEASVAIVGSRRASLYGLEVAERLAYDLALRGVTVVSGLARGIDGSAHRGALKAQGRTVGILGGGWCRFYPKEHEGLARQMVEHGAVISEYPMGMAPLAQNFPRRNRIISGVSLGVVIVEAAKRSGALITCNCALEQGREVFAIPGKINTVTSQGTNQLLREGAKLVTCVEDILEELRLVPQPATSHTTAPSPHEGHAGAHLTDEEQRLLAQLSPDEPLDLDAVSVNTGFSASTCAATLLSLELKRCVKQLPGKRFVRS